MDDQNLDQKTDDNLQNEETSTLDSMAYETIDIDIPNTNDTPSNDTPASSKKKEKKRRPFAYATGVTCLAFVASFSGSYLGNQANPSKSVIYQNVDSVSPVNASDKGLSIQEIAARNSDSVVEIQTEDTETFLNQTYVEKGAGSGVILTEDGYIVTNFHVVENATNINVKLHNGESYTATLVGTDKKTDIAVLKIDKNGLKPAILGDSDKIAVGDVAVAIGNSLGQLGGSVTDGIISALNRSVTISNQTMNLLQTNAQVSPGNSGGGLFNGNGELIGIVVAKSNAEDTEGISFAIPINDVKEVVEEIINHGYVTNRPTLGVYLSEIPVNDQGIKPGLYIQSVIDDSAAQKAGLQADDRIIAINDIEVSTYNELSRELSTLSVGNTVTIQVVRDGKTMSFECKLQNSTQTQ